MLETNAVKTCVHYSLHLIGIVYARGSLGHTQTNFKMESLYSTLLSFSSVIRVHHIYKRIWTPYLGEELLLATEESNLGSVGAMLQLNHFLGTVAPSPARRNLQSTVAKCIRCEVQLAHVLTLFVSSSKRICLLL